MDLASRISRASLRLPLLALATLGAGAALRALAFVSAAEVVWLAGLVVTGAPLVARAARGVMARAFAADLVASLAIVGAVLLREPVAGLVIVLMQAGGEALERYAAGRASDAVRELEAAAPRLAQRVAEDGSTVEIPAADVAVGDRLLVRPGELVPCDGEVVDGRSDVDVSRLTGEPVPIEASAGTRLLSGSVNGASPLVVRATAVADESQYERIVQLVRAAESSKSPLQRLADRYATWFTPVTLAACALAYLVSRDATRVLAVLVVATPCPLLLATPVAIVGGIGRAARRGIIVRSGGALEQLATVTVAVFDKTGTLTIGHPRVRAVHAVDSVGEDELLRLAASLEHGSSHPLARTMVDAARERGLQLTDAMEVMESPGRGVRGLVDGRRVVVGARTLIDETTRGARTLQDVDADPALRAYVAIDERLAGVIEYADALRPGLSPFFGALARLGVRRTLLLSGDRSANALAVARSVGIAEARGDLLATEKADAVKALTASGERVLMVGDGTNDAPALAEAAVGVALAGQGGGGISAEAADVVLLADDVTRVADAIRIARRTLRVARQSIGVGLGLSALAMLVSASGRIAPTTGALLQEAIDVAVILNSLRAR